MSTTDNIMALADEYANGRAGVYDWGTKQDGLRTAVAALVAERDQLADYSEALNARCIEDTKRTGELVAERDLAVHEKDVAQESLRRHEVWLQEAQAERDALKAESLLWSRRAGEDVDALRAVIDERDAKGHQVMRLLIEIDAIGQSLTKAEAERDALRQDAERYRWLRDMDEDPGVSLAAIFTDCNGSAESISKRIDAAVDAAMGEQK